MKKLIFATTIVLLGALVSCEKDLPVTDLVDFEELTLNNDGYWDGSGGEGGFTSGNLFFPNVYNAEYDSWYGFAYSNHTDDTTGDFTNQYSSIAGSGSHLSMNYGILFTWSADTIVFDLPEKVTNISLCNSTYAYFTMKEGNMFAGKFGGTDGTEEDWFFVKLTCIDQAGRQVATVTVYLADFRYEDSQQDYISNAWTDLDLSEAGFLKKIAFEFGSSDIGDYGINTPTYVCIDNIEGVIEESN